MPCERSEWSAVLMNRGRTKAPGPCLFVARRAVIQRTPTRGKGPRWEMASQRGEQASGRSFGLMVAAAMTEPKTLRTPAKSSRAARWMQSMQARKAHSLIGRVYDPRNLSRAWERVKENRGAGGVDGMTVARFEENRDHYLDLLHQKLKDGSYKPRPVLRVEIDKPGSTACVHSASRLSWIGCASKRWSTSWSRSSGRRFETRASAFAPDDRRTWPCGAPGGC
jgi:hypothetical protein